MSELLVGARVLQRYRVVRQLGRGGMGLVYLGRTEGADGFTRPVVIKQLHAALAACRELNQMFAREARILGSLQHANIVNVIDFGVENHAYVMVLEYVHGYDLDQWFRLVSQTRGQLSCEQALYIVRNVLAGLQHAHEAALPDGSPANIVHRDVSLSNVLLDTRAQVRLHDFGIARIEDGDELTQAGVFKGKLAMAAPEQLRGERATHRSDMYSTALMAYQLLAGSNPFRGQSEAETIFRIDQHVPPPLSSLRDDLPSELDAIVARALHKVPAARFESAAEFAEELAALGSRSDELIRRELERQLSEDFALLPQVLGLESLAVRDAAWRAPPDARVETRVTSSASPGTSAVSSTPESSSVPRTDWEEPAAPTRISAPAARFQALVLPLSAGGIALAALVLVAGRNPRGHPAPGYLLVGSAQGTEEPRLSAGTKGREQTTSSTQVPGSPGHAVAAPRRANPAELTLQFRAHRSALELCFRQHAEHSAEAGRVSLRFEVDRMGKVTGASILPAAVATSPLGGCLLQVARAARFGLLSEAVAFSIPITTRRRTE